MAPAFPIGFQRRPEKGGVRHGPTFILEEAYSDRLFFEKVVGFPYHKGKAVVKSMLVETYLRRGQRELQRLMLNPGIRGAGSVLANAGAGFLASAASLGGSPQPMAMGLICSASGGQAALRSLGALIGYPLFWGAAGSQGIVWAASGGLLAMLVGHREENKEQPLMIPAIAAFFVAVTGLVFQVFLQDRTKLVIYGLRIAMTLFSAALFTKAAQCRDAITDWLMLGLAALALAQVAPTAWLNLGFIGAGAVAVGGAFPGAALFGLGLDLAQVTRVPMTAVLCMAYFIRLIPFDRPWQRYIGPVVSYGILMSVWGVWEPMPLPGLALGAVLGSALPHRVELRHRRGETGAAQVRLEMGAEVMASVQQLVLEMQPPPIDREAILEKVRIKACGRCSKRNSCTEQLGWDSLDDPPLCRKEGRLMPELYRAKDQLRLLQADRRRQEEYRWALAQQYGFLGDYLRKLSDKLARKGEGAQIDFRVEVSTRYKQRERANGDRCVAFAGPGGCYYVLLCDGMGTGLGAAEESLSASVLLRQMLTAGFPAEHSLATVNSLLALRGEAGAVSLDLAQIRLDTGETFVYKWGAAPSWLLFRQGKKKIGTTTPPPGISVRGPKETVEKLSLCRGEVLILLSDGVDGEDALSRLSLAPDAPPGELAEQILEAGCGNGSDDATAVVIRLRPTGLVTS